MQCVYGNRRQRENGWVMTQSSTESVFLERYVKVSKRCVFIGPLIPGKKLQAAAEVIRLLLYQRRFEVYNA